MLEAGFCELFRHLWARKCYSEKEHFAINRIARQGALENSFSNADKNAANGNPSYDLATVDGVGYPVHRVADDPVACLHACCLQHFDQQIGHSFTHSGTSRVAWPGP